MVAPTRNAKSHRWSTVVSAALVSVVVSSVSCGHNGNGNGTPALDQAVQRGQGASSQYTGGPPYPGPCVKAGDKEADGEPDWVLNRVYNRHGNVIREVHDQGAYGRADAIIEYEYEDQKLVRRIKDGDADGSTDEIVTYNYDDEGRRTEEAVDADADGNDEKTTRLAYEDGKQVRKTVDYGTVGQKANGVWTYEYDGDRLVREKWDQDGDGTVDETTVYGYDDQGRLVREELYYGDEDRPAKVVEYERNDEGKILEEKVDQGGNGRINRHLQAEYDQQGRREKVVVDKGNDGTADQTTTFEYDDGGNLVRQKWDGGSDGTVDRDTTFSYECWR